MSQGNDIIIRLSAEGVEAITAAFRRVSTASRRVGRSVETIGRRADIARRGLLRVGSAARSMGRAVGAAGLAIGALGAGLTAAASDSLDGIAAQERFAKSVGLTLAQYQQLAFAAERAGFDVEALQGFLVNLADKAFDASIGAEGSAAQLADLGVSAVDARGRLKPLNQLFLELADSVAEMEDGTAKTGALSIFAGDDGARAITLLNQGSEGIRRQATEAERLGRVLSQSQVDLARSTVQARRELFSSLAALRDRLSLIVAPDLQRGAQDLSKYLTENRDAIDSWAEAKWGTIRDGVRDVIRVLSGEEPQIEWVARYAQNLRDLQGLLTGGDIESPFLSGLRDRVRELVEGMERAQSVARDAYAILSGDEGPLENSALEPLRDTWNRFSDDVSRAYRNVIRPTIDELKRLLDGAAQSLNSFFGLSGDSAITGQQLGIALVVAKLSGALGLLINVARLGLTVLATVFSGVSGIAAATVGLLASIRGARVAESQLEEVGQRANEIAATSGDAAGAAYQLAFIESVKNRFGVRATNAIAGAFGSIGIGPGAVDFEGAETQLRAIVETDPDAARRGFELAFSELGVPLRDGRAYVGTELDVQGATLSAEAQAQLSELETTLRVQGIELSDDVRRTLAEGLSTGASAAPLPAFSTGGRVFGPGTSTSDSILARLSRGEFVIRAAAVRKFGAGFFERLNNGALPAFATGGLVSMPSPALSAGLMSGAPARSGGRPVILNLPDGSQAELTGDADAVGALEKKLRRSATAQATRKPRWYR